MSKRKNRRARRQKTSAATNCTSVPQASSSQPELQISERLLRHIEYVAVDVIQGYNRNARRHERRQIRRLGDSILEFGFVVPILVNAENVIVAGHARLCAAKNVGMTEVPVLRLGHLTHEQVLALRIADNRLAELADWDLEKLAVELQYLVDINYEVTVTGFEIPEIDLVIGQQIAPASVGPADAIPETDDAHPISKLGDVWILDEHRLGCGDARDPVIYEAVLAGAQAQAVFTDPPYNVRIAGNVCGSGSVQHPEFIMASGEMSEEEYEAFLADFVRQLVRFSQDGSVHYLFIDWRHLHVLETVCRCYYTEQLNLCVWAKTNGGMGSLYRSQHELVLVFKNGKAKHINNVQLGKYERNRTNVWTYEGVNTLNADRKGDLTLHPTVKPVALIADAIKDCTKRKGLVLDSFAGSGTTIIAAEDTGRICRAIELDPRYVDTAVRRWEAFTAGKAFHQATGLSFAEMAEVRNSDVPLLPPPAAHSQNEA